MIEMGGHLYPRLMKMTQNPNILLILTDQQRTDTLGFRGQTPCRTPNMDRIAEKGVTFSNTYCGSPVCTPSRACLMTGMYPSDVGSYCNSTVWDGSHPTWGTRLGQAGYDCRATGKFDLHDDYPRGFKEIDASPKKWMDIGYRYRCWFKLHSLARFRNH